jgi:hypothetical protein
MRENVLFVLKYFNVYYRSNKRHKNLNIIEVYMMHVLYLSKNIKCWNMGAGMKNSVILLFQYGSWTMCCPFWHIHLMSESRCGQNLVHAKSLNFCLSHCCRSPGITVFIFRLSVFLQQGFDLYVFLFLKLIELNSTFLVWFHILTACRWK